MSSQTTRDHDEIRRWAQAHGATPSVVSRTGGMLRFEFAPNEPASLADISWDDFFHVFDERGLELVYDDKPGSRFHKLVYPESLAGTPPARRTPRAKVTPIRSSARAAGSARSPKAKPRLTRTGSKTTARAAAKKTAGKSARNANATRRRPRAA